MTKELGAIYTPEGHARILTSWAIQKKTDIILDMGVGPGVFTHQAYKRLIKLGATNSNAAKQIFGSEIDKVVFDIFTKKSTDMGVNFINIQNINYFDSSFPSLDAIVGNPPYVRRRGMDQGAVNSIRAKTLIDNPKIDIHDLSALSDLYIYFLLSSLPFLKKEGRLATIIADSWLNTRYGLVLKKYLLEEFHVHQIISLDRRVFENAQVKAVLLFATKKSNVSDEFKKIRFARVKNGLSINKLSSFVKKKEVETNKDIVVNIVNSNSLSAKSPWGAIFKTTTLFKEIEKKDIIKPMRDIAEIQIGLEALAKDFFVISAEKKRTDSIENEYLRPFIHSIYDFNYPVIGESDEPKQYIFYCDKPKENLLNTEALKHIVEGESINVNIRGTNKTVIGYNNKERIIKANRLFWYDIKTESEKKPMAEILIPRFIHKDYLILWNVARYIPGGATIQFFPKNTLFSLSVNIKIYLAILTSSFTEIAFRISAQVYGGGSSNLSITSIKESPTIDIAQLSDQQMQTLINAYDNFLETNNKNKINNAIYSILNLSKRKIEGMDHLLIELRNVSNSAKKDAHPANKSRNS